MALITSRLQIFILLITILYPLMELRRGFVTSAEIFIEKSEMSS